MNSDAETLRAVSVGRGGGERKRMNKLFLGAGIIPIILILTSQMAMAQQAGYNLTVNVPSWTFGHDGIKIEITTANGYRATGWVYTSQPPVSYTFAIPPNEGDTVQVCVPNDVVSDALSANCQYFTTNGQDSTVDMPQR